MNQQEFESHLEYRICREFSGMRDTKWRSLWCDGIVLGSMLLDESQPRILGRAWICQGQQQEEWSLELLLPQRLDSPDSIHWEKLLPAEDVTKWLTVRPEEKCIQIDPAAAVRDLD